MVSNFLTQNCSTRNLKNIYTELYKRSIIPFFIPVLMIISLMHIVKSKENINYYKYRIFLFLVGISIIILSESSLKLVEDNFISNIKLILVPFLSLLTIYFLLLYNLKLKFNYKKL